MTPRETIIRTKPATRFQVGYWAISQISVRKNYRFLISWRLGALAVKLFSLFCFSWRLGVLAVKLFFTSWRFN
jgi:hypothetical protein